jgi:hypothetical protein
MHVSNMMLRILPSTFDTLYSLFTLDSCMWVALLSSQLPNFVMLILVNDIWNHRLNGAFWQHGQKGS